MYAVLGKRAVNQNRQIFRKQAVRIDFLKQIAHINGLFPRYVVLRTFCLIWVKWRNFAKDKIDCCINGSIPVTKRKLRQRFRSCWSMMKVEGRVHAADCANPIAMVPIFENT